MFIDVTRYGGLRILRLQISAIAYLDQCEGGTAIHLVGGETLRVNEDPAQVEARVDAAIAAIYEPREGVMTVEEARAELSPKAEPEPPELAAFVPMVAPPAKPKKAGGKGK